MIPVGVHHSKQTGVLVFEPNKAQELSKEDAEKLLTLDPNFEIKKSKEVKAEKEEKPKKPKKSKEEKEK